MKHVDNAKWCLECSTEGVTFSCTTVSYTTCYKGDSLGCMTWHSCSVEMKYIPAAEHGVVEGKADKGTGSSWKEKKEPILKLVATFPEPFLESPRWTALLFSWKPDIAGHFYLLEILRFLILEMENCSLGRPSG